jgi:hypothetical protein
MVEISGNLWDWLERGMVAITTNGSVNRRGECPMPRGCARQARERFPELPATLGRLLAAQGNQVFELGHGLLSFPVEQHWLDRPDLRLIARSAQQLRQLADRRGWPLVVLPRPGCGGGGLAWEEVRPLLEPCLDQRFGVIAPPPA